ncbi:site-specific integrase [Christensenellaceae bacterium OttesenSCG-928-K19]|nr:site-specific integrase [Christensenellaceae bacterium OttesenSCG-928-K19]
MTKISGKRRDKGDGSIYQRKSDGRWVGRYKVDNELEPRYVYGKTETEVKRKLLELKKDVYRGVGGSKKVLFNDYFERWLVVYKRNILKVTSFDKYEETYRTQIKPHFLQKQLCNITPKDIQQVLDATVETVSYRRAEKVFRLIRSCYKYACDMGDIPVKKNPMLYCKLPDESLYKPKRPIIVFEKEQVYKLEKAAELRFCRNGNLKFGYGNLIVFLLHTGIRRGELLGLKWSDIDSEKKIVKIRRNVVKIRVFEVKDSLKDAKYEYKHVEQSPKTKNSIRDVPLNSKAIKALNEYKKRCIKKGNLQEYVARSTKGNPISSFMLTHTLQRMCEESDIDVERHSLHCLRHTFATRLLRAGVLVEQVSKWLGHADTSTTLEVYNHLMLNEKKESLEILECM